MGHRLIGADDESQSTRKKGPMLGTPPAKACHQSRWSVGRNRTSLTFIRSGWARSKSTLSADMVTARFTPGSGASASGYHHDCQLACCFPQDASRGR